MKNKLQIVKLPKGVSRVKFIICRHYEYFTTGMSLTNIVKYGVVLVGAGSILETRSANMAILALVAYAVFCYFMGMWWYKSGMIFAQHEVSNQFDAFEREMRELRDSLKNRKV